MKPFLGIDLTTEKKNEQINGNEFLVQKTSERLSDLFYGSAEKVMETIEKAELPIWLKIIRVICIMITLILIGSILKSVVSLAEGYELLPGFYWTAGICGLGWFILWLYDIKKYKKIFESMESEQTISEFEDMVSAVYTELDVPEDAKAVDVLSFHYKDKDGEIKVKEKGIQLAQYINCEFKVFSDSENLYFADMNGKYAFPFSSIGAFRTIKKRIRVISWNKEEAYNEGDYKQYKLTKDDYGCITCKAYHILEINSKNEVYGIYIPSYELPIFEELIGLKSQTE